MQNWQVTLCRTLFIMIVLTAATACNPSAPPENVHNIQVSVSGLTNGDQFSVAMYKTNLDGSPTQTMTITTNGVSTFPTKVNNGQTIFVFTSTQPEHGACTISYPEKVVSGTMTVTALCSSTTHTIGGTITGLDEDRSISIAVNLDNLTTLSSNGSFTLANPFADAAAYNVTIATLPDGQYCELSSTSGTISSDINLTITCRHAHALFTANNSYTGTGFGGRARANDYCSSYRNLYPSLSCDGGLVAFLSSSNNDQIQDMPENYNLDPLLPVYTVELSPTTTSTRNVRVYNKIADNWDDLLDGELDTSMDIYTFWIGSDTSGALENNCDNWTTGNDPNQTSNYANTHVTTNWIANSDCNHGTSIACLCINSTIEYSIGGTVSDLSGTLVLQNNSGDDLTITADGSFTFDTELDNGSDYAVTVKTNPTNQTCTVTDGSGSINSAVVTNVTVTCTDNPETNANVLFPTTDEIAASFGSRSQANALCVDEHDTNYSDITCDGIVAFISYSATDEIADFPANYNLDTSLQILDAANSDTKVADNWADLVDGSIDNGLTVSWWSGTYFVSYLNEFGDSNGFDCSDYTSIANTGAAVGLANQTSDFWGGTSTSGNCSETHRLMCLCYQEQ